MLLDHDAKDLTSPIFVEENDYSMEKGLDSFGKAGGKPDTLSRSSFSCKKQANKDIDEVSAKVFYTVARQVPTKTNSIVSIETVSKNRTF